MEKFSEIDLPSTILSIVLAGGFVAFAFLILRLLFQGIRFTLSKLKGGGGKSSSDAPKGKI